ncbi:Alcohol dehydrogenase, N-terminal [Dillenia turbinata]|uniref:Alcohol dehydrogenase, N-terminal n=1 Tax=Dillenia turbinata TaxID=194707 RepID=A0AAN8VZT5_9MAGN
MSPQVITCKAAVCWGAGEPAEVEEIEVDPPKAGEVRVKLLCASLCRSDIICRYGYQMTPNEFRYDAIHFCREIESIGEGVTDLNVGDVVIPAYLGECKLCENCLSGKTNLCFKYPIPMNGLMPDGTSRMRAKGQTLYQFLGCSTWAEYGVINTNYVVKIDPKLPLAHASFISCGFSTGFGATWKEAKVEKGSSVAVFGLGTVGLGAVEGARVSGATKIIGIDKNGMKKEKGEAFGMTDFINPEEYDKPTSEVIKDLTGGLGVDYAFECTGFTPLVNEVLESTKVGKGAAFVIGTGNSKTVELNFVTLLTGRSLKGSIFGGIKPKTDLGFVIDKCMNKVNPLDNYQFAVVTYLALQSNAHLSLLPISIEQEINLDELLTHEVSLEEVNKSFELLKQPDCVKVLINI